MDQSVAEFATKSLRLLSRKGNKAPKKKQIVEAAPPTIAKDSDEKLCVTCKQYIPSSVYDVHVTKCLHTKYSRGQNGVFVDFCVAY
jgi:hypothetical protein